LLYKKDLPELLHECMVSGQEEEKATHPVHVAEEEGNEAEPHDDVTPGDAAPP
jgi:hypothetical protein